MVYGGVAENIQVYLSSLCEIFKVRNVGFSWNIGLPK